MRRKLFVAALLLTITGIAASAQFKLGVKAGINSSSASLSTVDTKSIVGYHIGAAAQVDLPFGLDLQTGLSYQVKGLKLEDDSATGSIFNTKTNRYSYLEVPLQLQWGLDLILLRPYVLGEIFAGYAVDKKLSEDGSGSTLIHNGDSNFKSKFEYGYAYGFGADILSWQISVKYFKNLGGLESETVGAAPAQGKKDNFDGISISFVKFF